MRTMMNLKAHHPSWKTAAIVVLVRHIKNTNKWNKRSIKLILTTADIPKHAVFPSGQCINLIQCLNMSFAVKSSKKAIAIQNRENTMYPILAKTLDLTPHILKHPHRALHQALPAHHSALPAHKHIFLYYLIININQF